MRTLARYWFIIPLLLLVIGLQLGASFITNHDTVTASARRSSITSLPARISTSLPTLTRTLTPRSIVTPSPTFTASSTRTATPTDLPTDTPVPTDTPLPSATPRPTSTFTPEPTPIGEGFGMSVPILMYHYLSVPPDDADAIRQDLSVTPAQFEAHLAYLRQSGYETISMQELSYALSQQMPLPPKPIIITFDDGYRDNYDNAFPLLRKYGYTATFFVFTQPIDANNANYLTWEMIIEMHRAGMEFGSHSYRHSDLQDKDVDFLVYEILGSKEAIEERIKEPVRFFSYPAGRYDELTIQVLESAHFWSAATTEWGMEQSFENRFEMSRIRVRGNDTVAELDEKLNAF